MPNVKFYANLRILVGAKERAVTGSSVRLVLENLSSCFPDLKSHVLNGNRLRAIITLNGHTLDPETGLDALVSEKDQIAIFPPLSGG